MSPTKVSICHDDLAPSSIFTDDWLSIDLTRLARRAMRRGEEVLQMKKMRRGRYLHKYAFVEIVTKVGCSHD